jgi:hypothetical protein
MMSKLSELALIILNCIEYNRGKLKKFYPKMNSSEEFLQIELELGICLAVMLLLSIEKLHWEGLEKEKSPEELIKMLIKLINNSKRRISAEEQILYLQTEIKEAVLFVENIKYSMKSKTLQYVEKYLNELLEEEI